MCMCATDYNKITRYNEVCFFITLEIHPQCRSIRVHAEQCPFSWLSKQLSFTPNPPQISNSGTVWSRVTTHFISPRRTLPSHYNIQYVLCRTIKHYCHSNQCEVHSRLTTSIYIYRTFAHLRRYQDQSHLRTVHE